MRIFAQQAGVDELELLRELTTANRDAIRLRASCDRAVAVADGLALIGSAKDMVAAAVCSLFKPTAAYRGRPRKEVLDYMRGVQLAGMEQGSLVVTLLPPAVPPAVAGVIEHATGEHESGNVSPDEPIERQATRRLAEALGATRQAMGQAIGGEGDAFGDAIPNGTSANLCAALANMTAPFEALDVSLTWALTRPLRDAGAVSRFEFAKDDSCILREAARALRERRVEADVRLTRPSGPRAREHGTRERRVEADVRLTATVEGLKRRGRELTLRTHLASGTRSIIASVTEADYKHAIDCHRANAKVVLTGDLEYSGGRWRLLKPRIAT